MLRILISTAILNFTLNLTANAQEFKEPSIKEQTSSIIKNVKYYAKSISCYDEDDITNPNLIAALEPYKVDKDFYHKSGNFAVIWRGDFGCEGAKTIDSYIAIVRPEARMSNFPVIPGESSPQVEFKLNLWPVKIAGATQDRIVVDGYAYDVDDSNSFASLVVRATLKVDSKGNWHEIERKIMGKRKQNND